MVKRRLVYQIAGYDPVDAAKQHRRFVRGIPTFARTWNVTVAASELAAAAEHAPAHWTVTSCASNWRVDATYVPLPWSDIVLNDFERSTSRRLALFGMALFDFFRTATVFRYFRARWKYGLFFLYPALHLLAYAALGLWLGSGLASAMRLPGAAHGILAALIGVAVFLLLLKTLGRRWRVVQALDDWIFAWDYLHGRRFDVEARLNQFAQSIVEAARDTRYDEIVVVGHSLGATLAVNIVARALDRDPAFGTRGTPVTLLTVGSTIPKFTFHPDAVRIRLDVARVAASGAVQWAEYHARADPISFWRTDPLTGRKVRDRFDRKPIIRMTRICNMVEESTYRRIRFKFMRMHHQFVMANERRTAYDYYMMGCGPLPIDRVVKEFGGPLAFIAADGALLETAASDVAGTTAEADLPGRIAAAGGRRP